MILNILGGGGSGKTTLKMALLQFTETFVGFVSYTTRPQRQGEINGVHYHFVTEKQFFSNDSIVLSRVADSYHYGVSVYDLEPRIGNKIILTTFDVDGIKALERMGQYVKVVYLNIAEGERRRRMCLRGDRISDIEKRIALDRSRVGATGFASSILDISGGDVTEIVERVKLFVR